MSLKITGPIVGGTHGRPFAAALIDLAALGYLEEEYFFEGDAPLYRPVGELGIDGRWTAEPNGSMPVKTRAVVRRPIDSARFNGTVIVEWNNVSAGTEIFEAGDTPVIFDEGFAYVGVSAQRVGVHGFDAYPQGLLTWDPERYGSLHIKDDSTSYGIFTEVARAFASDRSTASSATTDPLGGLNVRTLLAVGGSQSAGRLMTYINAVHPLARLFDGFIAFTWFGSGSSLDDPSIIDLAAGGLAALARFPTRIREDLDVPVMIVNSECETLSCSGVRQPDTDRFRYWEVAGAAHGPRMHMERILPKMERDGVALPGAVDTSTMGPVPWAPVLDAALVHVNGWILGGPPPPTQPLIELEGEPPHIRRDANGNAVGGLRLPEQEVTLTCNVGAYEEAGAAGLMGLATPLTPEVVHALYPDRAAYESAFASAAQSAVDAGVLRPRDADDAIALAKTNAFP
jgi:hypothetical protein